MTVYLHTKFLLFEEKYFRHDILFNNLQNYISSELFYIIQSGREFKKIKVYWNLFKLGQLSVSLCLKYEYYECRKTNTLYTNFFILEMQYYQHKVFAQFSVGPLLYGKQKLF